MQTARLNRRSTCPVSTALDILGDRWSLLIVRDLMFGGARTYKDLRSSAEGIATNILASRLQALREAGIVTSRRDPEDGRSILYALTPKGIDLAPVLLELNRWGTRHEGGLPPPGLVEAWDADPRAFLADIRRNLSAR